MVLRKPESLLKLFFFGGVCCEYWHLLEFECRCDVNVYVIFFECGVF